MFTHPDTAPDLPMDIATNPTPIAVCNQLHHVAGRHAESAREHAEKAAHYAVILGLRLEKLKTQTERGKWQPLFLSRGEDPKSVTCDRFAFSYETGQRYIRAAEGALARPGLPASARNSILAIAEKPHLGELEEPEFQALEKATRGETLRQLYLDLGIIRASATEKTPTGPTRKGQGTDTNEPDPGADPERSFADDAYLGLAEPTRTLTRLLERGELALCETERVRDLAAIWRSFADDAETILKDRKAQA